MSTQNCKITIVIIEGNKTDSKLDILKNKEDWKKIIIYFLEGIVTNSQCKSRREEKLFDLVLHFSLQALLEQ